MSDAPLAQTRETLRVGGDEMTFRATGETTGGALIAYEIMIESGGGPPALHRHASAELFRIESGELAFYLEDASGEVVRSVTGAGAVVTIPGGREHTVRNESDAAATAFVVLTPGDELERFARAAAKLGEAGPPPIAEVLALAASHGIEITRMLDSVSAA